MPAYLFDKTLLMIDKLSTLANFLTQEIDANRYDDITPQAVRQHIREGTILEFLKEHMRDDFKLYLLDLPQRLDLLVELAHVDSRFETLANAGIRRRGLCLMVSYLLQAIQNIYAGITVHFIPDEDPIRENPAEVDELDDLAEAE